MYRYSTEKLVTYRSPTEGLVTYHCPAGRLVIRPTNLLQTDGDVPLVHKRTSDVPLTHRTDW